jgi:putative ABC transport system substrate-binding protein
MRWREFIALVSGAVAWPLAASAQQSKMITIGILVRGAPGWQQFWDIFRQDLRELGYTEGRTFAVNFGLTEESSGAFRN